MQEKSGQEKEENPKTIQLATRPGDLGHRRGKKMEKTK